MSTATETQIVTRLIEQARAWDREAASQAGCARRATNDTTRGMYESAADTYRLCSDRLIALATALIDERRQRPSVARVPMAPSPMKIMNYSSWVSIRPARPHEIEKYFEALRPQHPTGGDFGVVDGEAIAHDLQGLRVVLTDMATAECNG